MQRISRPDPVMAEPAIDLAAFESTLMAGMGKKQSKGMSP